MWLYPWTVGGWAGAPICCPMTVPTISLDLPTSLARYPSFPLKSLSPTGAECIWERNGASHKPLTHSPEGGRGCRALVSQYGFPSWESLGNSLELPEPICWLTWRWWRCLPWSLWESIEVTKHWVLEWVSHWVPRFQGLLYKHILSNSHNWESRNYCLLLAKSRVEMMKWVPQSHTVEKYLSQDGFIPLSLAPKLEMFYLFTSVHEALSLRQRHRDFQGVPAAFSFVGIINTATYPCTICPCSSHCNTLSVTASSFPHWRLFSQLQLIIPQGHVFHLSTAENSTFENQWVWAGSLHPQRLSDSLWHHLTTR